MKMNKKVITSKELEHLVDRAVYREAEADNLEIGHALKSISESELKEILNVGKKKRKLNKLLWERVEWSIAVAALIAVAITLPISIENRAKDKICNIVYDYNIEELEYLSLPSRSSSESFPDITIMTYKQLKEFLPGFEREFEESDNLQDISIRGKILALGYIRLHKREEAIKVLEEMISRLSNDVDYSEAVSECMALMQQIK